MKKLNNNQNNQEIQESEEKREFERKMKIIAQANECNVLMSLLCKQLGLTPYKTTHQEFVNKFSEVMKLSLEYQKELQEQYIATTEVKTRKKRENKADVDQLELIVESS